MLLSSKKEHRGVAHPRTPRRLRLPAAHHLVVHPEWTISMRRVSQTPASNGNFPPGQSRLRYPARVKVMKRTRKGTKLSYPFADVIKSEDELRAMIGVPSEL